MPPASMPPNTPRIDTLRKYGVRRSMPLPTTVQDRETSGISAIKKARPTPPVIALLVSLRRTSPPQAHQQGDDRRRRSRLLDRTDPAGLPVLDGCRQGHRAPHAVLPERVDAWGVRRHGCRWHLPCDPRHAADHRGRGGHLGAHRSHDGDLPGRVRPGTVGPLRDLLRRRDDRHPVDRGRALRLCPVRGLLRARGAVRRRRLGRALRADDPDRGAVVRGDAPPGAQRVARGGLRPGCAEMAGDPQGGRADGAGGHRDRHHARGRTGHRRDRPLAGHRRSDRLDQYERLRGAHDDAPGVRVPAVLPGPRLVPRGRDGLHPHHQHRPGLGGRPDTDPHRDAAQPHRPADHPLLRPPRSALRGRHPVAQRIDITDLNVYYGAFRAVADVTMAIEPRSVTEIIGPSGCGKSTFIRTLNRMHEVIPGARVEGKVAMDGVDLYGSDVDPVAVRRQVGMVFQRPNPFPTMSVAENVLAGIRLNNRRISKSDGADLVERSLRRANLWNEVKDRLDRPGSSLSGGQQQRLCIARAIAVKPQVLLMDEPASALDPISTLAIEDLIAELKDDYTIVIVTHNMQQAARVSDRTAFFNLTVAGEPGRLVEMDETRVIFSTPSEKATEDYISGRFG